MVTDLLSGERIRKDAAKNRVHVALSRLRGRGLKAFIQRIDERYLLAPELSVHRLARIDPPAHTGAEAD